MVYFSTRDSAIAQSAQEEKSDTIVSIEEPKEAPEINSGAPVISESLGVIEEEQAEEPTEVLAEPAEAIKKLSQQDEVSSEEVKNLIGDNTKKGTKDSRGMINEGKSNQGKLKLSLVLFILFLVGVVAWLLWVNRELVKERRAQNEAEEKAEKEKNDQANAGQKDKLL